ncbi:MAG: YopX family protein [Firmicutes bacterium]|nr:YopX family protein [Bacillota bacterium]
MRDDYLFRGKSEGEIWRKGDLMRGFFPSSIEKIQWCIQFIYSSRPETSFFTSLPVDPVTVGRCTGVKDENGNLVFEGDIVKIYDKIAEKYMLGIIIWQHGQFIIDVQNVTGNNGLDNFWELINTISTTGIANVEIIGNIHDNPELLPIESEE